MPSSAPTVTTPLPPMPATSTFTGRLVSATGASGSPAKGASPPGSEAPPPALRTLPPSTLTKLGQ